MTHTLQTIADTIGATLKGDGAIEIERISPLQSAIAGSVSFLANKKYQAQLSETKASGVILAANMADSCPTACLIVDNPYLGFARAAALFDNTPTPVAGVHPKAAVAASATIHPSAMIEAGCVIGENCMIGEGAHLHPNVTLYHGVTIGARVTLHAGVVIGADGFGMAKDEQGAWLKVPQLGGVIIEDDVDVGANTTIDRGALEDTVICQGAKLDNQIQIAHNVKIGAYTAIAGCVGIAGSTRIGKRCLIGGGACIDGHLSICDGTMIGGMAMVTRSITEPGMYASGTGLMPYRPWRKSVARFKQLDELAHRIKTLEGSQL